MPHWPKDGGARTSPAHNVTFRALSVVYHDVTLLSRGIKWADVTTTPPYLCEFLLRPFVGSFRGSFRLTHVLIKILRAPWTRGLYAFLPDYCGLTD